MPRRPIKVKFPAAGVVRRQALHQEGRREPFPAVYSSNVRLQCPIAKRLRGGSRAGLTKLVSDDLGTTIAGMVPVKVSSLASGAEELLVVLVDSTLVVVDSGTLGTPTASAPSSGYMVAGNQMVYVVTSSAIKKFDPKTGTLTTVSATAGTIPTGCTFGAVYRDRMVIGGGDNAIYMSKHGDFTNWFFGKDLSNTGRAIQFQLSHASKIGAQTTAMIPHDKGDHLLCATSRSLWVVSGDPAAGGALNRVDPNVGIIASGAWCKVKDEYVFLAEDGLYKVSADGGGLESLTEDRLPEELRNIDTSTYTPMLGYDHDLQAIHIYLPTTAGAVATDTHWMFELNGGQFWPMHLSADHSPKVICEYNGDLLLGGSDGYVRKTSGSDDDGTNIDSHVLMGPFQLGQVGNYGRVLNLHGTIASGSANVNWRLVIADTAEEAAANGKSAIEAVIAGNTGFEYVGSRGKWSAGRAHVSYPRDRAAWCCLWLHSEGEWAYESVLLNAKLSGTWR